jgi:hypothetical protein
MECGNAAISGTSKEENHNDASPRHNPMNDGIHSYAAVNKIGRKEANHWTRSQQYHNLG